MQILIDISHGEERLAGLPLEELALFVLERAGCFRGVSLVHR